MEEFSFIEHVMPILISVFTSSAIWTAVLTFLNKRSERKDIKTQMLIGLGHDRIVYLGTSYIKRGYVTIDEFENLNEYLYKPYAKLGGNGSAKRIMDEVAKLPIHNSIYYEKGELNHEAK